MTIMPLGKQSLHPTLLFINFEIKKNKSCNLKKNILIKKHKKQSIFMYKFNVTSINTQR